MATSLSSPHYVSLLPSRKSTPVSRPAHPPTIALPQFKFGYHKKVYPAINPSRPELSAAGKTILITGGGKSIGKAILTSFALAGAKNIIITGREQAALERARDEIQTRCPETNIYAYAADVIDSERYREILEGVKAKIAPIDVLVLNAAYLPVPQPIEEMDINEFWKGFEINVKANTALAQLFCRTCSTSPTLINVSSYLAWLGAIGFAAQGYSASKAAFDLLMQYLAFQRPDMRIFTMHPGCIVSEMSTKVGADTSKSDRFDDVMLPGGFAVCLSSSRADFLRGKTLEANWDVDDMEKQADVISRNVDFAEMELSAPLTVGLVGRSLPVGKYGEHLRDS